MFWKILLIALLIVIIISVILILMFKEFFYRLSYDDADFYKEDLAALNREKATQYKHKKEES
jgi:hypothetical protein